MARLGSNMEACLNVAEPQMDIFYFFLGVGSCREEISARLPTIRALDRYLLSAYYAPFHQHYKEERQKKNLGRSY